MLFLGTAISLKSRVRRFLATPCTKNIPQLTISCHPKLQRRKESVFFIDNDLTSIKFFSNYQFHHQSPIQFPSHNLFLLRNHNRATKHIFNNLRRKFSRLFSEPINNFHCSFEYSLFSFWIFRFFLSAALIFWKKFKSALARWLWFASIYVFEMRKLCTSSCNFHIVDLNFFLCNQQFTRNV